MNHTLPDAPNMEHLRALAKRLLAAARAQDPAAMARMAAWLRSTSDALKPTLSAAQLVVAREYGFSSWSKLKRRIGGTKLQNMGGSGQRSGPPQPMSDPPLQLSRRTPRKWPAVVVIAGLVVSIGLGVRWLAGAEHGEDVKRIAHANPELQAAAQRAQSELDSFVAQLQNPRRGEQFAIKGAFSTPLGPEYLWVRDPQYRSGKFLGTLDQPPIAYHGAQKGDQVTVARADVFDWMIRDGNQTQGGYTEQVLARQQRGQ